MPTTGWSTASQKRRARTGDGQHIELAMLDMAANLIAEQVLEHDVYGHLMRCEGNRSPTAVPQGAYGCHRPETWVAVSVATDSEWSRLRDVLGDPEWARDPILATAEGRTAAREVLDKGVAEWFAARSSADALAALDAGGVPAEAVVAAYDVDGDEQMRARAFWEAIDHPVVGRVTYPGWPMRMSQVRGPWFRHPAPLLGQHNDEVLGAELGLTSDELEALRAAGVIGDRPAR